MIEFFSNDVFFLIKRFLSIYVSSSAGTPFDHKMRIQICKFASVYIYIYGVISDP